MPGKKRNQHIPVNILPEGACVGIMMMRENFHGAPDHEEVERAHRDGGYTFILQEQGTTQVQIDFHTYHIQAPAVVYIHPAQVHRVIAFENALISTWIITGENLRLEYLNLLDKLSPVGPLVLAPATLSILSETAILCLRFADQKEKKLYSSILKDSCNTLVGLVISQYLSVAGPAEVHSRSAVIDREFKLALELHFKRVKDPSAYADQLNLSTSYLNECVKMTSGRSVSAHIRDRVVLEAKRILYHSNFSVKEISAQLGYDDHSYFTRLFTKVAGMSPGHFRDKNRE